MKKVIILQVYEHLSLEITILKDTYTFKTPKGFGGRFYYSLCNDIADVLENEYPEIYKNLQK